MKTKTVSGREPEATSGKEKNKNRLGFGQRFTSLILLLSGIVVLITSLVLYVAPPTHVAEFGGWRLTGLDKCGWNALHIMGGLLFLVAMCFHAWFNRRPIFAYLKNRKREMVVFTRPFMAALLLTTYVCVGSLLEWQPMGGIIGWIRSVKIGHVRHYKTPPYGGATAAPLSTIAVYMGWDVEGCMAALRENGIQVAGGGETLDDVSRKSGLSIGALLDIMNTGDDTKTAEALR